MTEVKRKTLEDKLYESIRGAGLRRKERSPEEALKDALDKTTPSHPGYPTPNSEEDDISQPEWI